jgi:hypothetical protein
LVPLDPADSHRTPIRMVKSDRNGQTATKPDVR